MKWTQVIDPFNNITLSVLVAAIPILFIFWALIIRKMKGYQASLIATVIASIIAILVYGMPVKLAILSIGHGALYGLFPICWLVVMAVFLFNLTVKSGQFEIIKHFMASITSDRRLQALLIAFSFGSFLEGTAGFGAPVAITAAMLVGLGFNPLYASGICLIANTAPVAFGSIGIPITVASQVSGIPELPISQMVGRGLPLLSLVLPFYLVSIIAGFNKAREILPAVLVSGASFAFFQWFSSNYLGPSLPDVIAGLGSIICLMILLRFWKPKTVWRFSNEPAPTLNTDIHYTNGQILRAWSPFIVLTIMVIAWGMQPIKDVLNSLGMTQFEVPGLHNAIQGADGTLLAKVFKVNYLSAAGTAILIAGLVSIPLIGLTYRQGLTVFGATLHQLRFPILTIAAVLGFAYIVNDSGITLTLAKVLANTGVLFPFFAPVLGWLGVFITGSDTSANALFSKLQFATAQSIGVDPVVTVASNVTGGVVGKMISPQSIAVAAAAGDLIGKESDLFRFTVKHSFIMLVIICFITLGQAYTFKWMIPTYEMLSSSSTATSPDASRGFSYLFGLAIILIGLTATVRIMTKTKKQTPTLVD
ncbi:L-lactate permease [Spirosoma terrae]|uniref:L-lactate permease n=1 Tax=Spirosoma terrae TaxID=1968276 RepID=A0A6L9L694_9BACT|nr:lactate permease LctP family transporter [Spirosoma terrae]NDU95984.1 L-lactate permease [Spirosoma terrae]